MALSNEPDGAYNYTSIALRLRLGPDCLDGDCFRAKDHRGIKSSSLGHYQEASFI